MTINLDDAGTIATILAGAAGFAAFLFAVLRYLIRAETAELRTNGGSTMKDKINRIDEAAKVAAEKAEEAAKTAAASKKALDEHVRESRSLIEQGDKEKDRIWKALSNVTGALPTIAASTPPEAS